MEAQPKCLVVRLAESPGHPSAVFLVTQRVHSLLSATTALGPEASAWALYFPHTSPALPTQK